MYLSSEVIELLARHRHAFVVEIVKWTTCSGDLLPLLCLVLHAASAGGDPGRATLQQQVALQLLLCAALAQALLATVGPDLCGSELAEFRTASAGPAERQTQVVLGKVLSKYGP